MRRNRAAHTSAHCPPWALNTEHHSTPIAPERRWQPRWQPHPYQPLPGYERFIANILTSLDIDWVYEPLMVPIPCRQDPDDSRCKRRRDSRLIVPDFWLPEYECFIEVYEGASATNQRHKLQRLGRMTYLHRCASVLVTRQEHAQILQREPYRLYEWIVRATRSPSALFPAA